MSEWVVVYLNDMSLAQVKSEMAALQKRMAALQISGATASAKTLRNRRRRQRRRARERTGNGAAVVAPMMQAPAVGRAQGAGGGRRRNRRRGLGINPEGQVRVSRTELLVELNGSTSKAIDMSLGNFTWLKMLATAFDRVTWHSAELMWKPAVGTTTDGLVAYGVDWNSSPKSNWVRKDILALTPIADHPVWQTTECEPLVLPSQKLMSRKEYFIQSSNKTETQPGTILIACTGTDQAKVHGELWIRYDVSLFGTA